MAADKTVSTIFNVIASLCGWGAFGMGIASVASTEWLTSSIGNSGLWKRCLLGECVAIPDVEAYLEATRAFMILFVIFNLLANLMNVHSQWKCNKHTRSGSGGIFTIAATMAVIGATVYSTHAPRNGMDYGTGYILAWAVVGMCFFGGLCQSVSALKMKDCRVS